MSDTKGSGWTDWIRRIPFMAPILSLPQRSGPGVFLSVVVVSTSADTSINHGLGYTPTMYWIVDSGTILTPKMKRGAASWSNLSMALVFDTLGTFTLFVR